MNSEPQDDLDARTAETNGAPPANVPAGADPARLMNALEIDRTVLAPRLDSDPRDRGGNENDNSGSYAVTVIIQKTELPAPQTPAPGAYVVHGTWRDGAWVGELAAGTCTWDAQGAQHLLGPTLAELEAARQRLARQRRINHGLFSAVVTLVLVACLGGAGVLAAWATRSSAIEHAQESVARTITAASQKQIAATEQKLTATTQALSSAQRQLSTAREELNETRQQFSIARQLDSMAREAVSLILRDEPTEALPKIDQAIERYQKLRDRRATLDLLLSVGIAFNQRSNFASAEDALSRALEMAKAMPDGSASVIEARVGLAAAYRGLRRNAEAIYQLEFVLDDRSRAWGDDDDRLLPILREMVDLKMQIRNWSGAEADARRRLKILEIYFGPASPHAVDDLGDLAVALLRQDKVDPAASACKRLLMIEPAIEDAARPYLVKSLRELAGIFADRGSSLQAITLLERAMGATRGKINFADVQNPHDLRLLARLYVRRTRYQQAEAALMRLLELREQMGTSDDPQFADDASELAELYERQRRWSEAEALCRLALEIRERTLGIDHHDVAKSASRLAELYRIQGKNSEADALYELARDIHTKGPVEKAER